MGALFLVATPIGNLEDVTMRALRVLREVSLIAAEDTRTIRKLLTHHRIAARRLVSYTDRNRKRRTGELLDALAQGDIALVSEAGTPGISDPGVDLVSAAAAAGHRVVPVPGPSALVAALTASGLPTRRFHYLGFLPRQPGARRRLLKELVASPDTLVAFEAPHRLVAALHDALDVLGDRRIAVCRELTKVYEEVFRGTLSEAIVHFAEPRGEFTLVVEGAQDAAHAAMPQAEVDRRLRTLRDRGATPRDAVRQVVEDSGLPRSVVYARWLALSRRERA
jgi:16S rRNA (cytidine1402-2'-O)-methyltransferase